jgi:hypothetical protein
MEDEVRFNIKRTELAYPDTRIYTRLNWAQSLICDWHTYEEMRKTYTGSTIAYVSTTGEGKRYGFPTRMKDIHSLTVQKLSSSKKLTYVPAREFDLKVPRPEQTSTGTPSFYVDYGVNFELFRLPDAVLPLNLRCSVYAPDMVTDIASELLRKDALIVAIATKMCLDSLRELEDANYWKNEVVPELYTASVLSDHNAEDWLPVARGFGTTSERLGTYWANPLVKSM